MIDYTTYDDVALMRVMTQPGGDQQAFTVFYHRHVAHVYKNILAFVKSPQEAEEAVQEVFARIWQKRSYLEITENIEGYLVTACRNIVIDLFRKSKKDRELFERLKEAARIEANNMEDQANAIAEEQWAMLQRALELLPEGRRKAFELCKVKGVSYAEACQELGITMQTLKDHIWKAKRDLKDHLSGKGEMAVMLFILLDLLGD